MTTTAVNRVFIDTNVLVYAAVIASPLNAAAMRALADLRAAGAELWISRQVIREFASAITRPGVKNPPATGAEVNQAVNLMLAEFLVAEDGPAVTAEWLALLGAIPCGGKQVHDANIAATMLAHGVPTLLTHNVADFRRFEPRITVMPLVP